MDLSYTVYSKTGKGTRALSARAKDLPAGALKVLPLIDGQTDAATILGQLGKTSEIDFRILLSQLEASGYIRAMHKQTWDLADSDTDSPSGMVVEELYPDDFFGKDAAPAGQADVEAQATARAEEANRIERAAQKARDTEEAARLEAERIAREEAERAAKEARIQAEAEAQARAEAERAAQEAQRKAAEEARIRAEEAARLETERTAREKAERAAEEARTMAAAETKARMEAERIAREERKAREAEEAARRKAQAEAERAIREAQRKAGEEARARTEEAAKLEAERIAREKAEHEAEAARLQAAAEAQARAEEAARLALERQQAREAEEARHQQEADSRARAEAERQEREAELARGKAEAEARAQAEQAARLEAERLAREAEERRAQTEQAARRQQEADSKARAEAERQARKAEEARLKAEADEAKRRAKEETRLRAEEAVRDKLARKEQERAERRARKMAASLAKRNAALSGTEIASAIKSMALYLPLLLILLIVALHFVNLAPLGAPVARIASDSLGEPVHFNGLRASLFPQPRLVLSDVAIGPERDMQLGTVTVALTMSTLFDGTRPLERLEIMDAALDVAELERPRAWFAAAAKAGKLRIAQVSFRQVVLAVPGLAPQPYDGRIDLRPDGEFDSVELRSAEHRLTLLFTPDAGQWKIAVDASDWQPPLRTGLKFDELHAEGTIAGQKASFERAEGRIYGGTFTGRGVIDWSARPRAYGSFEADNIGLPAALAAAGSAAKVEGSLQTAATFTAAADAAEGLLEEIGVNAKFLVTHGKLGGVDLASAMLPANREKSTHFDKLSGNLQLNKGVYHYRNLLLTGQQFHAHGSVDIQENSALTGRIGAELTMPSRRMQSDFGLGGTVGNVWMR